MNYLASITVATKSLLKKCSKQPSPGNVQLLGFFTIIVFVAEDVAPLLSVTVSSTL